MADNTQEGLLLAIRAAPDDNLPRLAYADWLEEAGDKDRAEFIRLGCNPSPRTGEEFKIYAREGDLLRKHKKEWLPKAWVDRGSYMHSGYFKKGFLEFYEGSTDNFLAAKNEPDKTRLLRSAQIALGNKIAASGKLQQEFCSCPLTQQLQSLHLDYNPAYAKNQEIRYSMSTPEPQNLNGFLRHLCENPPPELKELALRNIQCDMQTATIIAGSPVWKNIEKFSTNNLEEGFLDMLLSLSSENSLREISASIYDMPILLRHASKLGKIERFEFRVDMPYLPSEDAEQFYAMRQQFLQALEQGLFPRLIEVGSYIHEERPVEKQIGDILKRHKEAKTEEEAARKAAEKAARERPASQEVTSPQEPAPTDQAAIQDYSGQAPPKKGRRAPK